MKSQLRYLFTHDYAARRHDILSFWEESEQENRTDLFDSFYVGNPQGEPSLGLCYHDSRLVGTENYLRQLLVYRGETFRSEIGVDTFIHPDYRLFHGILGKLWLLTIAELEKRSEFLFTNPNEDSIKYYVEKFNWKTIAQVEVHKKVTNSSGWIAQSVLSFIRPGREYRDTLLVPVDRFVPSVLDPVVERYRDWAPHAYFFKDSDFINWKFLDNKHHDSQGYLIYSTEKLVGYCITCETSEELKIIDIVIERDDKRTFSKVLSTLSMISRNKHKKRLVISATENAWYKPVLRSLFFFKRWQNPVIGFACREELELPRNEWIIQEGDFDTF